MILANEGAQTRPYQYDVTVCLSVPPTKQFGEAPVVTVQWFVCLSVAMTTSQGNGYGTQSNRILLHNNLLSTPSEVTEIERSWNFLDFRAPSKSFVMRFSALKFSVLNGWALV